MNGSKVFRKLDLKLGYHQLELSPQSQPLPHPMGCFHINAYSLVSVLPVNNIEHEIASVLAGIEGAENISDNTVVHGPDTETHDKRLRQTIERLQECGLTLNAEKCLFNMDR